MTTPISIVICSYNEAEHIPSLLQSLCEQTANKFSFKVIFVDNNSDDDTKAIVEQYNTKIQIQYVLEKKRGKSYALNTGWSLAQTEYVAFTDADIKLDENWVSKIQQIILEQRPHILGGPYHPFYTRKPPHWFRDKYNMRYLGDEARQLDPAHEELSGANIIFRKSILIEQGGYETDANMKMYRGLILGEETDLIQRCIKNIPDFSMYYDPQLIVYHYTRPITYSLPSVLKRRWLKGINEVRIYRNLPQQKQSIPQLLLEIVKLIWAIVAGLAYALIKRDKEQFPYIENYLYEKTFSYVRFIGRNYGAIRQRLSKSHES